MTDISAPSPTGPLNGLLNTKAGQWVRENLFSSWVNSAATLVILYLVLKLLFGFVSWALFNAVWTVDGQNTQACRDVKGIGACWALVAEKYRFIVFGIYPYEEQWRELAAILIFVALYLISSMRRFWSLNLIYVWLVG